MEGELGGVPGGIGRQTRIGRERLRQREVEARALAGQEIGGDRLHQERMPERVGLAIAVLHEDLMGHRLPNRLAEAWLRGLVKGCQQSVRNAAPRGGGHAKDLLGGRRQGLDPQHQGVAEVGRELLEAVMGGSEQLLCEEGVSLGTLEQARRELRIGRGSEDALQLSREFRRREWLQVETLHRLEALVLGEERSERVPAVQLVAAVGADQEERCLRGVGDQERKQVARRSIGPVEILHREHHRVFASQAYEQGEELLEQPPLGEAASSERRRPLVRGVRGCKRAHLGD